MANDLHVMLIIRTYYFHLPCTDMHHLTMRIRSKKCVVRQFCHCANVHKLRYYSLLHTSAIWYSLLLLDYKPVQHVSVLNTVGSFNTMVSSIIYYYLMAPLSHKQSVID